MNLGIFINEKTIDIIEGETTGGYTVKVAKAISVPTPADAVQDGIVLQPGQVGSRLRKALDNHAIKTKNAYVAMYGPSVSFREMFLPKCKPRELERLVQNEIMQVVNPEQSYSVDYAILNEEQRDTGTYYRVSATTASLEAVQRLKETVKAAGLTPAALDVSHNCLMNFMQHYIIEYDPYIILDMHDDFEMIVLVDSNTKVVARNIQIGGREIEEDEKRQMNLTRKTTQNISKTMVFLRSQAGNKSVKTIYYTKAFEPYKKMVGDIARSFGVKSKMVENPEFVQNDNDIDAAQYCCSIGAIIRN